MKPHLQTTLTTLLEYVTSWSSLNAALFGLAGVLWSEMREGNLSFQPNARDGQAGLQLSPVYDMLPMLYAPARGVEIPARTFEPKLPLPAEREAWERAARAATEFWQVAAADQRISASFRAICADNATVQIKLMSR